MEHVEQVISQASTEDDALLLMKYSIMYNLTGIALPASIKKANTLINEYRKFANEMQQQRMSDFTEEHKGQ